MGIKKEAEIIAIIPARGGSKGLPHKNIRNLCGRPLISYTISSARDCGIFDNIVVSTDSVEIAQIANDFGAETPFLRPSELSSDSASSLDVVLHCLDYYEEIGVRYNQVCLLQPTSPLRSSGNILEAYSLFTNSDANSVVSVCKCDHSPLWTGTLEADLRMDSFVNVGIKNKPRQDMQQYYRINGAIYICKVTFLRDVKGFIGNNTLAYIMDSNNSIDIDTLDDFNYAEYIICRNSNEHDKGENDENFNGSL